MADQTNKVRRRPVDALFGEKDTAAPSYVVEPARPATNIAPPSPSKQKAAPPAKNPPPPPKVEPVAPQVAAPKPVAPKPFAPKRAAPAPEPTYTPPQTYTPPAYEPPADDYSPASAPSFLDAPEIAPEAAPLATEPLVTQPIATPPAASSADGEFTHIGEMIQQLYDQVTAELYDSPVVTEYCLKMLMQAREAYFKKDYATAEFYVESVGAKIKRSQRSVEASRSLKMVLLWLWEFAMLGLSAIIIALTYVPGLAILDIVIAGDPAILLRAVGWGGVGGVIGALYNLPWFIQFREYDPAYNMNYFARPLQAMLIGAILFLLSQAGILAGNTVIPTLGMTSENSVSLGPVFLYLLSALAGFKQEYVYEFIDNLLKMIFRIPDVPSEIKMPTLPKS